MRKKIAAANWKMNGDLQQVQHFAHALSQINSENTVVFSPPLPYLAAAKQYDGFGLSAQNASEHTQGAFTGEVSMTMLNDIGCQYVIIGHSERRALYHETDDVAFNKVKAAYQNSLIPILCIGETDEQNLAGETEAVLAKQLEHVISGLSVEQKQHLVIAYEPVWAIGTGRTPSIEDIQAIHKKIRYLFSQNDDTISSSVSILYGGSVNPDNAEAIFSCPDVDGGLVGGASLTIESFEKIIKAL